LGTATDAIAKAYGGNTKALGTLLPSVRSLIKEGASLDEVFAAVAGTVGGSAAVAANSAEGQMKRLSLTIGETKESIGAAFLPILERLLPVLQRFAQYAQNNTDKVLAVMAVVGSLAGAILANRPGRYGCSAVGRWLWCAGRQDWKRQKRIRHHGQLHHWHF
jgi:hypothetical protein